MQVMKMNFFEFAKLLKERLDLKTSTNFNFQ